MGPGRVRTGTGYEPDPGAVPTRVHRAWPTRFAGCSRSRNSTSTRS